MTVSKTSSATPVEMNAMQPAAASSVPPFGRRLSDGQEPPARSELCGARVDTNTNRIPLYLKDIALNTGEKSTASITLARDHSLCIAVYDWSNPHDDESYKELMFKSGDLRALAITVAAEREEAPADVLELPEKLAEHANPSHNRENKVNVFQFMMEIQSLAARDRIPYTFKGR